MAADVIPPHASPTAPSIPPAPLVPPPPPPPTSPLPPPSSPPQITRLGETTHSPPPSIHPIATPPPPAGTPSKLTKPSSPLLFQLALPITLRCSASTSPRGSFTALSLDHPPNFPSHIGGGDDERMETIDERAVGLLRSLVESPSEPSTATPSSARGAQSEGTMAVEVKGPPVALLVKSGGGGGIGDELAGDEVWAGWAAELGDELENREHGSGDGYLWV